MTDTQIDFDALTPTSDIYGNTLAVGTRVRSFDFSAFYDGELFGVDADGPRAAYRDGVIEAIGDEWLEGCPRYSIRYDRFVFGGRVQSLTRVPADERYVFPPLNGTPTLLGRVTFNVVALTEDAKETH